MVLAPLEYTLFSTKVYITFASFRTMASTCLVLLYYLLLRQRFFPLLHKVCEMNITSIRLQLILATLSLLMEAILFSPTAKLKADPYYVLSIALLKFPSGTINGAGMKDPSLRLMLLLGLLTMWMLKA